MFHIFGMDISFIVVRDDFSEGICGSVYVGEFDYFTIPDNDLITVDVSLCLVKICSMRKL